MSFLSIVGEISKGCAVSGLRHFYRSESDRPALRANTLAYDNSLALGVSLLQAGEVFRAANIARPLLFRPTAVNLLSIAPYIIKVLRNRTVNAPNKILNNIFDKSYRAISIGSYLITAITSVALIAMGNYALGLTTIGVLAYQFYDIKNKNFDAIIMTTSIVALLYLQPINALLFIGEIAGLFGTITDNLRSDSELGPI